MLYEVRIKHEDGTETRQPIEAKDDESAVSEVSNFIRSDARKTFSGCVIELYRVENNKSVYVSRLGEETKES